MRFYNGRISRKEQSLRNEKAVGQQLNLVPVKGSGCGRRKGDFTTPDGAWMIEAKSTDAASISVKKAWIEKLIDEAQQERKSPALLLDYGTLKLIAITEADFLAYLQYLEADQ